jgi:hypothetical protein
MATTTTASSSSSSSSVASSLREVKDVPLRQAPDLGGAAVALGAVLGAARDGLLAAVQSCGGDKCLVVDPSVAGPLKLVLSDSLAALRKHGVLEVQELNWGDLESKCGTVIYLLRPESKTTLQVASQVKSAGRRFRYRVHFVPRRSFLCEQLLRNAGVSELVEVFEYPLGFVPHDTDVVSLGLDASFAQVNLRSDDSSLMYSARALLQLQEAVGVIANIQVKGDQSKKVLDMMLRMRLEAEEEQASEALDREMSGAAASPDDEVFGSDEEDQSVDLENTATARADGLDGDLNFAMALHASAGEQQIDTLLLLDRNIDLVTPMVTALTYEALLDSLIGVRNGHATVDAELVEGVQSGNANARGKKVSMSLNSADHIYKAVRDMNIDAVLGFLNARARDIKDNWQEVKARDVDGLHSYVQTSLISHVAESQLLPRHVNLVNRLRDTVYDLPFRRMWQVERAMLEGENQLAYVDECIARQEPWTKVLRLACLQSIVGNGIAPQQLDQLRRAVVHTYGFELVFTLDNLEQLGMLKRKAGPNPWAGLVSAFRLLPASDANDVAYVTSGYAPLAVRLVQMAIRPGWDKAKEALKRLPGRLITKVKQPGLNVNGGGAKIDSTATAAANATVTNATATATTTGLETPPRKKVMMVFITGGVTFAEIAALRYVASQEDCPYHIIIGSTAIINGKTMLQAIAAKMENRLVQ